VPAAQLVHVEMAVAPVAAEYVPAKHAPPVFDAQLVQAVVAVMTAVQADDVAPPADHVPAGHEPVPDAVAVLASQYLPAGQGRHVDAPARL